MNGLRNSNLQDNEIVKASDVQMIGDGGIENLGKTLKTLFGSTKNVIVGGKISAYTVGSGLMAKMNPVMGIHADNENLFIDHEGKFYVDGDTEPSEIITFTAAGSGARRDIVEVKASDITAIEQSRQFYDPESGGTSHSKTNIEKRQILILKVKAGTNGSDTAPTTDEGFVKIAEVVIPANAIKLDNSNIFNVTADIEGIDNVGWTTEKQVTINPGTLQKITEKFRAIHNTDGSLKDTIIAASKLILSGTGALQGSAIQKGGDAQTVDGESVPATSSIATFIDKIIARLNKVWEPSKGGTGQTTLSDAANSMINSLSSGDSDPADNDYFISQYVNGGTTTTTYHRRPLSKLWNYIKGKISNDLGLTKTAYGGKATTAGTADNSNALGTYSEAKLNSILVGSQTPTNYQTKKAYAVGNYVWYNNKLYRCITAVASTSTSWEAAKWVEVVPLPISVTSASSATKLSTARNLKVALGSTTDASFDGSANQTSIPVSGTLAIANGGTGATTAAGIKTNLSLSKTDVGLGNVENTSAATTATASTIAKRDANGYLYATYFNQSSSTEDTKTASRYWFESDSDGWLRKCTGARFREMLGLGKTTGAVPVANGGTGATTVAGARNALGLGNTAGALPVANGGTGATDAATARTNLGLGNVENSKDIAKTVHASFYCGSSDCVPVLYKKTLTAASSNLTFIFGMSKAGQTSYQCTLTYKGATSGKLKYTTDNDLLYSSSTETDGTVRFWPANSERTFASGSSIYILGVYY